MDPGVIGGNGNVHYGVCSNYLKNVSINETMYVFIRSAVNFNMPDNTKTPMILVGPGTGIAPFRGFWNHRQAQMENMKDIEFGKIWLFFGCRQKELDLYRNEKNKMIENKVLDREFLALSREPGTEKRLHVQCTTNVEVSVDFRLPIRCDARVPPQVQDDVEKAFADDPSTSCRVISRLVGASKSLVHRIIRQTGKKPYRLTKVQELLPRDLPVRVAFCGRFLAQTRRDEGFPSTILWSDECTFTRSGAFNQHNTHNWAHENPHGHRSLKFQHRWFVNVWAGILGGQIIGPVFLPANLNGARYLDCLQNQLPVLLEDVPLDRRGNIISQQDRCLAHYAVAMPEHLHAIFLWGYIKSIVYKTTPRDVNECQNRIRDAFSSLDGNMVRRTSQGVIMRAELVLQENGGHIEH
ncbi:hypothetical protein TKK_0017110 [Trichogramma kaykai]